MDRFNALGRGMQVMLVAGVLLIIDTFFNWQSVEVAGVGDFGVSAWDDIGGIIMALLTIVLVAWIGARAAGIDIPVPVSATLLAAAFGVLIFLLALIKNLQDDYSSIWAWIGLILAAAILVGAWLQVQASGGMDALRTELPGMPASTSTASPSAPVPPAAAAPPPPPPSAPAPPPSAPAPPPPAAEPAPPAESTPESAPSSEEPERTG
jgi:hypothetical protein